MINCYQNLFSSFCLFFGLLFFYGISAKVDRTSRSISSSNDEFTSNVLSEFYSPDYNFNLTEVSRINLDSTKCHTSVYAENFLYVGCKNRVAIIDIFNQRTTIPVSYTPRCEQIENTCGDNQVLALSPLKKNLLVCFSELRRTFVCTRFRKATSEIDLVIDPIDPSFEFRAQFINPVQVNPTLFDDRRNLFLSGYLGSYPEVMKLNLDDSSSYTAALKIDRGFHNKPGQIISASAEFIASVQIDDFVYVFINEVYEENKAQNSKLGNKTQHPNDGRQRARVIRVCANDQPSIMNFKLWSYFVKASLSCLSNDSIFMKLTSIEYDKDSKLLFATFTAQESFISGTAICSYDVNMLSQKFSQSFFKWSFTNELLSFENPYPNFKCSQKDKEAFSGLTENFKLTVQEPIEPQASKLVKNFKILKIIPKTYIDSQTRKIKTVTFGITQNGFLLRHHFLDAGTICELQPMKFNHDSVMDQKVTGVHLVPGKGQRSLDQLAIVYESEVIMVPMHRCESMSSQRACLASQDPFCFWDDNLWSPNGETKCVPVADDSDIGKGDFLKNFLGLSQYPLSLSHTHTHTDRHTHTHTPPPTLTHIHTQTHTHTHTHTLTYTHTNTHAHTQTHTPHPR